MKLAHDAVKGCRIFIFRSTHNCPWQSRSWVLCCMETILVGDLWCGRSVVGDFWSRLFCVTHQLKYDSIVSFLPPSTTSDDTKDVCFPQRAVNLAQSIVQLFHMLTLIGSRRYKKLLRAWSRFEASWKDRWCCVQMWFMRYAFTSLMFIHLDVSTIYPSSRFEDAAC